MSSRHVLRIGAVSAILGGLLAVVANVAHPREPGQLDSAAELLRVVDGSSVWVADHVLILISISLFLGAYFGLTHSITSKVGAVWARLAWGVAVVGVALGIAFMVTEIVALPSLAHAWANSSGPDREISLAAGTAIFELSLALSTGTPLFLFGLTPALYGVAILGATDYARWLGWGAVLFGSLVTIASFILLFAGVSTLAGLVLLPIGILGVTLWIITLGVIIWRNSAAKEAELGGSS